MTSNASLKIVHEAEAQRQHVRIEIPASVKIGTQMYKIKDISAGGFSIYAPEGAEIASGKVKFIFPFTNYALQLEGNAQLVNDNKEKKTAHFRFIELDAAQMSLINYIVNARMTGTIVTGPDLISTTARNNFVEFKPRSTAQAKKGFASTFKRVFPTILISAMGLGFAAFFIANIYENAAIIKSYQGVVEAEEITVRTHAEGNIRYLISDQAEKVTKGQPLVAVERIADSQNALPGESSETTILSPCDCVILRQEARNGEFRTFGEPLFTLVPSDTKPWIAMLVDSEQAHHLRLQDDVNVRVTGEGGFVIGHIMDIMSDGIDKPFTKIKIRPEKSVSLDMLGRPAYAEFTTYK